MKYLFPKYIIEDGKLFIGKVTFHKELAENINNVKGGGFFHFDTETNTFYLYGKSHDFGQAKIEDVKNAVNNGFAGAKHRYNRYKNFNFIYSEGSTLADVFLEGVKL